MNPLSEKKFCEIMQPKLGGLFNRALDVFKNCGPNLGWDVANVLLRATDQGKVEVVLDIIEEHYRSHLSFQHPEIRGTVSNLFGFNPTRETFVRICEKTLGLQPNKT